MLPSILHHGHWWAKVLLRGLRKRRVPLHRCWRIQPGLQLLGPSHNIAQVDSEVYMSAIPSSLGESMGRQKKWNDDSDHDPRLATLLCDIFWSILASLSAPGFFWQQLFRLPGCNRLWLRLAQGKPSSHLHHLHLAITSRSTSKVTDSSS